MYIVRVIILTNIIKIKVDKTMRDIKRFRSLRLRVSNILSTSTHYKQGEYFKTTLANFHDCLEFLIGTNAHVRNQHHSNHAMNDSLCHNNFYLFYVC